MTSNPTVLITGCSAGGIGGALAQAFHDKGYHVFATARTPSKISASLAKSPNVTVLTLDVLSTTSIAEAVISVRVKTGGKLDVLVNNSGGGMLLPALDSPIEEGKKLFDLNFWAALAMVQAFAPLLQASGGCLVNNTSVNGVMPMPFFSLYNASKSALIIASETWRLELAILGIRTITLVTGGVKTNFFEGGGNILPDDSQYSSARETFIELGDGRLQAEGMNAKDYAEKVVNAVNKGAVGKLWVGGAAGMAKWGSWLMPQWVIDKLLENLIPVAKKMASVQKSRKE